MKIRDLVLSAKSGFRSKVITVPEWENAEITIREPSAKAWLEWQEVIYPADGEEAPVLTATEKASRDLRADVLLFIDILFDGDQRVFNEDDIPNILAIYGPVHARIVKQALNLSLAPDEAEKK